MLYNLRCVKNTAASSLKNTEGIYIARMEIKLRKFLLRTMTIFIIQNNFKTDHILYREILQHSCFVAV